MKFSTVALSLAALASSALAQLEILSPGGPDLWWVAQSQNVVVWTCETSPYGNFTIAIANSNPDILVSPFPFIAEQENYDCSEAISQYQVTMPVADNYTILFIDPQNSAEVYATSKPFEIKALGAAYPPASATPTGTNTASSSSTGAASASTTASSKKSGAGKVSSSFGGLAMLAAALGVVMA
ncbi:hypothetical protein WOLCODRAFT_139371 [Wolfiporia cocos MD-104 SS10]|uniref:Uncharacterized protein n=1 Tax=Wolfiporia cocos (strain MD-104) TaxID=742152 RepID=A0A2H3JSC5_WOLCO|nr:hypothetical protein WOLCODRAFT_139371 [Wolfiporia cocos MD-104 SS10]